MQGIAVDWQPSLSGELAVQVEHVVEEIASELQALEDDALRDPSYAGGWAGIALFHGYASEAIQDSALADSARRCLERSLDLLFEQQPPVGLFDGFTGVAWTLHHLEEVLGGEPDGEATEDVDEMLVEMLRVRPWTWHFDLVYGLAGIGIYALDHPGDRVRRHLVEAVVGQLDELAVPQATGATWRTPPELIKVEAVRQRYPQGYLNLGLAHGVPGVIGFLARALRAGHDTDRLRRLLDAAVSWLLTQRRQEDGGSVYASLAEDPGSCRSAWCYGDPGVAMALMGAAIAADRSDWRAAATELALRDGARPTAETGLVDPGLCHGAVGQAHTLSWLHRGAARAELHDSAQFWYRRALEMRRPGVGTAGYVNWWPEIEEWRAAGPGLLTGVAGVGLGLTAAISGRAPAWGRPMLWWW